MRNVQLGGLVALAVFSDPTERTLSQLRVPTTTNLGLGNIKKLCGYLNAFEEHPLKKSIELDSWLCTIPPTSNESFRRGTKKREKRSI